MESVIEALKRLANGAAADGYPTDARHLREVEKRVAELIAAVEGLKFDKHEATTPEMIAHFGKRDIVVVDVKSLRALNAALIACKGQDHER